VATAGAAAFNEARVSFVARVSPFAAGSKDHSAVLEYLQMRTLIRRLTLSEHSPFSSVLKHVHSFCGLHFARTLIGCHRAWAIMHVGVFLIGGNTPGIGGPSDFGLFDPTLHPYQFS
jgi:hypothetical protein